MVMEELFANGGAGYPRGQRDGRVLVLGVPGHRFENRWRDLGFFAVLLRMISSSYPWEGGIWVSTAVEWWGFLAKYGLDGNRM